MSFTSSWYCLLSDNSASFLNLAFNSSLYQIPAYHLQNDLSTERSEKETKVQRLIGPHLLPRFGTGEDEISPLKEVTEGRTIGWRKGVPDAPERSIRHGALRQKNGSYISEVVREAVNTRWGGDEEWSNGFGIVDVKPYGVGWLGIVGHRLRAPEVPYSATI